MIIKIKNEELIQELIGEIKEFPRYATQILNLANQNAQGARPRVVGQLSELIKECPEKTYEGWKNWYLAKYPKAIENASEKINEMVNNLKEAILKKVAHIKKLEYRLSAPQEESKGIDGFIGDDAVSIKPITYKTKSSLRENIEAKIIYYDKTKNGLNIDASELLN